MHSPESGQENETHKFSQGFWSWKWSSDPVQLAKKEDLPSSGFCLPSGPQSENQRKQKKRQVLRPCQRTEKAVKYECDGDTSFVIVIGTLWTVPNV